MNAIVAADPDVDARRLVHRRGPRSDGQHRHDVHRAQAAASSASQRRRGDRAAAAASSRRSRASTLFLQAAQDVRIGGRAARTQYQYTLAGREPRRAPRRGRRGCSTRCKKLPELKDVATRSADRRPPARPWQSIATPPRASASRRRPSTTRSTTPSASGRWRRPSPQLNQYRVVLEVKPELRAEPGRRSTQLYVRSRRGAQVPLSRVRQVRSRGNAPLAVNHQGQFPAVTLSFNLAPGVALGQAVDAIHARRARDRPAGQRPRRASRARRRPSARRCASQPLPDPGARCIAVYIVLGMLYESFVHPITILSTLPSAGVGALLALLLSRHRAAASSR